MERAQLPRSNLKSKAETWSWLVEFYGSSTSQRLHRPNCLRSVDSLRAKSRANEVGGGVGGAPTRLMLAPGGSLIGLRVSGLCFRC